MYETFEITHYGRSTSGKGHGAHFSLILIAERYYTVVETVAWYCQGGAAGDRAVGDVTAAYVRPRARHGSFIILPH